MIGSVVQGRFAQGLPRMPPFFAQPPFAPPPAPRPVGLQRLASHIQPRAAGPVVQRLANGLALQLPAELANFGAGSGQRLPAVVQEKMEALFKTSFADVRVHVGPQAAAFGALALTCGTNLFFAPGQYEPLTPRGQQLLGHELAHVVQQRAGRVRNPFGTGIAVIQDHALEAEAERMGLKAARPGPGSLVQAKLATPVSGSHRHAGAPAWQPVARIIQRADDLPKSLGYSSIGKDTPPDVLEEAVRRSGLGGQYTGHLSGKPGDSEHPSTKKANRIIAENVREIRVEKKKEKKLKGQQDKEKGFGKRGCPAAKKHASLKKRGITQCGVCGADL